MTAPSARLVEIARSRADVLRREAHDLTRALEALDAVAAEVRTGRSRRTVKAVAA